MRVFLALLTMTFVSCGAIFLIFAVSRTGAQIPQAPPIGISRDEPLPSQRLVLQPKEPTKFKPVDEYVETMLRFQYSYQQAFYAGLCHVRSDAYVNVFRVAQSKLSIATAQRLGLSSGDSARADAEVNRRFAKTREGLPEFDLIKGCEHLRTSPSMGELDDLHRRLTVNYQ
ncbi:MAG: hypothetical protein QOJ86_3350 [Bradyrhizobium sp.]|nr:hypothetical protein [Bradyrhizobium sp.]